MDETRARRINRKLLQCGQLLITIPPACRRGVGHVVPTPAHPHEQLPHRAQGDRQLVPIPPDQQ